MEKDQEHIDDLIAKYLAGEASSDEITRVEAWKEQSVLNRQYVDQFSTIFSHAAAAKDHQTFDTDAAWSKVKQSLEHDRKVVRFPAPASNRSLYWKIAAGFLLTVLAGIYLMTNHQPDTAAVVLSSHTETVADTLPDGSSVFLNKESTIRYAYSRNSKEHRVELKGEAFFTIKHDEKKQFVVDVDGVLIRDIGTAFNVKAGLNTIEVVVNEGEVMFYTEEDSGVYLQAGAKGVYDKKLKKFNIEQPEANVLSYKTRVFNFNNTELAVVVRQLNGVYARQIELSPAVGLCRLTVGFNNESQEEIIAVITETLGLKATESNGKILLDGPGCTP